MSAEAVCEFLEWDSKFFGRRIARMNGSRLSEELVGQIDSWCGLHRIECLYLLADATDGLTARLAQANMFRFVDVRMTLDFRVGAFGDGGGSARFKVRDACEADIPGLRKLARDSHRDTRFYYDGNFSDAECDRLYEEWIEKSVRGWADQVFVAEESGELCGYLTCHRRDSRSGQIGLVGVSEEARGKGIGTELLSSGIQWFAQKEVENLSVVTQGRNVRAQRFYQRCGFSTRSVEYWFHRWFLEPRNTG